MLSPLCTKMSWEHLTSTISASYDHAKVELFCKKYLTCHHDYVNVLISFTVHFFYSSLMLSKSFASYFLLPMVRRLDKNLQISSIKKSFHTIFLK